MTSVTAPSGYELVVGPPDLESYLRLRQTPGLTPRILEQSLAGLNGAWYACHVCYTPEAPHGETASELESNRPKPEIVAMGRVIGDGGWYFHITDMSVSPDHQRKGLGGLVLEELLRKIKADALPDAYVNLIADSAGTGLYKKFGFEDAAPEGTAMHRKI